MLDGHIGDGHSEQGKSDEILRIWPVQESVRQWVELVIKRRAGERREWSGGEIIQTYLPFSRMQSSF